MQFHSQSRGPPSLLFGLRCWHIFCYHRLSDIACNTLLQQAAAAAAAATAVQQRDSHTQPTGQQQQQQDTSSKHLPAVVVVNHRCCLHAPLCCAPGMYQFVREYKNRLFNTMENQTLLTIWDILILKKKCSKSSRNTFHWRRRSSSRASPATDRDGNGSSSSILPTVVLLPLPHTHCLYIRANRSFISIPCKSGPKRLFLIRKKVLYPRGM